MWRSEVNDESYFSPFVILRQGFSLTWSFCQPTLSDLQAPGTCLLPHSWCCDISRHICSSMWGQLTMLREGLTSAQHALHQRSQRPTHDLFSTNNSLLSFGSSPLLPSSLVISFSYSLLPCVSNIHRALFLFKMVWVCATLQTFSCDEPAYIPISRGGSRETQTPEKIPKLYVEASAATIVSQWMRMEFLSLLYGCVFHFCIRPMHLSLASSAVLLPNRVYGIPTWKCC